MAGREEMLAVMRNAFAAGSRQMLNAPREVDIVAMNGERKSVLVSAFAVDTAHGYPDRIDLSRYYRTPPYRAGAACQRGAVSGTPGKSEHAIIAFDADGAILYLNHVAVSQLGRPLEDLTGKRMDEIFPEPFATQQMAHVRAVFESGESAVVESLAMIAAAARGGSGRRCSPSATRRGRVVQVLVNSTDIHDLKTTQQQLIDLNRTLEDRVRQRTASSRLLINAPAGYHSVDGEGRIVPVNQPS